MANIPSEHKEIFCLVTVDGDLRVGDCWQQKASVEAMREVHAALGLTGKTTWFINEFDFQWTSEHPELLLELVDNGECLGVHDHQDTCFADDYQQARTLMQASRYRLDDFFKRSRRNVSLPAHRNGCAVQSQAFYQVAIELGYAFVSDVRPGLSWSARMIKQYGQWVCLNEDDPRSIFMDNQCIPLGTCPWYHNADNWMDYSSRQGPLLQVPITSMPGVIPARVKSAIENSNEQAFIVIDIHPYDLQDPKTGDVSVERLAAYQEALAWMKDEYHAQFIRFDQLHRKLSERLLVRRKE